MPKVAYKIEMHTIKNMVKSHKKLQLLQWAPAANQHHLLAISAKIILLFSFYGRKNVWELSRWYLAGCLEGAAIENEHIQ